MIKKEGLPVNSELVLCTVKRIMPHCAFVSLDEYDSKEGMLHIGEVSLKGVRDIKDHLSVNKQLVCKVLRVDEAKGEVDLSLKRVKPAEMNRKLNEARLEKRLYKIVEHVCSKLSCDAINVVNSLLNNYDSLIELYNDLKSRGVLILNEVSLTPKVKDALTKQFNELLEQIKVSVKKTINLNTTEGDGLSRIKSLLNLLKSTPEVNFSVKYLGAPKYLVTVTARNYKLAEQAFTENFNLIEAKAKQLNVKVNLIG